MDAQHIRDLQTLPEPTKSLVLNVARSRSLSDVSALRHHIISEQAKIPPLSCYHIAAIIPYSLDPVPDELAGITKGSKRLVQRSRVLLEILSGLAHMSHSSDRHCSMLANYILSHHDRIFPWLDFLQHHYFGRSDPSLAGDERMMSFTLLGILRVVSRVIDALDRTEHCTLGKMVIHIWHKLLHMDSIYTRPDLQLQRIVLVIDGILPMFLLTRDLTLHSPPPQIPQYISDAVGGPSAVIAFTLARMERDILHIAPQLDGIDIPYTGMRGSFINLAAFASSSMYGPKLVEQRAITRSVNILKQVIEGGPPLALFPVSDLPVSDQVVHACIAFISLTPNCGPEAVSEILESSFIYTLRTTRLQPTQVTLQAMQSFPFLIVSYFLYPSIIKRSKKHTPPTETCTTPKLWELYDAYVSAYGYLWDRAGSMARNFDHCATCKVTESDCHLKVCAGCRVTKYCSSECQQLSWKTGHRINCLMFRCSHSHRTTVTSCRDFFYLALVEHFILQASTARAQIETALASIRRLPLSDTDEIPVFLPTIPPLQPSAEVVRMKKYPEIFGTHEWRDLLLPKFRALIYTGRIKHLTVLMCPAGSEEGHILGALASTMASGMVDKSSWDREAEYFEARRPRIWPLFG